MILNLRRRMERGCSGTTTQQVIPHHHHTINRRCALHSTMSLLIYNYLSTMYAFESTAQGQWHQPEEVTELIAQTQQSSEDLVYNNEKVTDMTHHSIS